ncbi:MAG TPA: ATP-binding protein [Candidatus Sulfotelmatobacter sp.]|nr:ATP-binding protein [Candidatus Sulfotelmatobacter sp.]
MDYLSDFLSQTRLRLFAAILMSNIALIALGLILHAFLSLNVATIAAVLVGVGIILSFLFALLITDYLSAPMRTVWQAIMYLAPDTTGIAAPDVKKLKYGNSLVTSMVNQVYQLASVSSTAKTEESKKIGDISRNFIAQNLPLPFFVLDPTETIKFANQAAANYLGIQVSDLIGKNVYMVLDMSFPSEDTFDNWLKKVKGNSATASNTWERVKLDVRDTHPTRMFDLASYYNQSNPDGIETLLVIFDHTKLYSQEDQAVSFMALSVHELRSPLTLLRGYIEVFEDELGQQVDESLRDFIEKMNAQADLLMAYINNILNVTRVDDDQLELKLTESDWAMVLQSAIDSMKLRAKVRGITLNLKIEDNLPKVGVDRLSIQEVVGNLVDNAIKYSGESREINIESHLAKDGTVETTVQDFGVGIPSTAVPNLFTKFYRDHHNRSQIGGTGLGLYLSKALVKAHGGNLWVRSIEGQGSTFGFSVLPYSQLSAEAKTNENREITRSAHGWIKNHSLYRR